MYFNIMGYYWVLIGLHYNSTLSLEKKLNEDEYSERETITFKFHLTLPYSLGEPAFERAEGQFEYNGAYYHLVKQQYAQDTLYLVCIRNHETQRINQALNDYVKTFANQPTGPPSSDAGKTVKILPTLLKDYLAQEFSILHSSAGWAVALQFANSKQGHLASHHQVIIQPPEGA
jgi:hypothetical protein